MRYRTALLVMAVVMTALLPPARADWLDPLPEGTPSKFNWDQMSGYWVRHQVQDNYVYISREGILDSTKTIKGNVFYFIGRWQVVRELKPARADVNAIIVMAGNEKFCDLLNIEHHPHFRLLEYSLDYYRDYRLRIDYNIDVFPPVDVLLAPSTDLWALFLSGARGTYKDEGSWYKIDESAAPPWFRDQVKHLVLSGRFACEEAPAKK